MLAIEMYAATLNTNGRVKYLLPMVTRETTKVTSRSEKVNSTFGRAPQNQDSPA